MKIEQLYTNCLAEAAYYIESNGQVAIIDPLRDVNPYLQMAQNDGAVIKYIFETHFHADFVSGHVDLANKSGATIVYGPTANTDFNATIATDGQIFPLGDIQIKVLHTPGHTPESSCFLLIDENGHEHALFTGDTLFLGDVGRPDLAIKSDLTQEDLAVMLFDSLRNKIMPLGHDLIIYPGHGAGSSCGKNMSKETIGSLGEQLETNYALRQDMTKEEFIHEVTTGILPPPQYFPKNAMMNKLGYGAYDEILERGTKALSLTDFQNEVDKGALILDVRNQADFSKGFIPNALFIGLNGTFAMWVGALIEDIKQSIVLIADEGKEEEAVMRLARVGYDHCIGYLKGGVVTYENAGLTLNKINGVDAETVAKNYPNIHLVDIRKPGEYDAEHVENVQSLPLDFMLHHLDTLDKSETYYIHCAGGYRSVIGISLLMKNGYKNLIDVYGGYAALAKTNIPKTAFVCPSTLK